MTTLISGFLQIFSSIITEIQTYIGLHNVTFDRVSSGHLDDSKPIVPDINDFANANYLLNKEELQQQRSEFIILVARVLLQFFPVLQPLKDAVPEHISHRCIF